MSRDPPISPMSRAAARPDFSNVQGGGAPRRRRSTWSSPAISLSKIAKSEYGTRTPGNTIYEANRDIPQGSRQDLPGQKLKIPPKP
jgi:hypothetical protein